MRTALLICEGDCTPAHVLTDIETLTSRVMQQRVPHLVDHMARLSRQVRYTPHVWVRTVAGRQGLHRVRTFYYACEQCHSERVYGNQQT